MKLQKLPPHKGGRGVLEGERRPPPCSLSDPSPSPPLPSPPSVGGDDAGQAAVRHHRGGGLRPLLRAGGRGRGGGAPRPLQACGLFALEGRGGREGGSPPPRPSQGLPLPRPFFWRACVRPRQASASPEGGPPGGAFRALGDLLASGRTSSMMGRRPLHRERERWCTSVCTCWPLPRV